MQSGLSEMGGAGALRPRSPHYRGGTQSVSARLMRYWRTWNAWQNISRRGRMINWK